MDEVFTMNREHLEMILRYALMGWEVKLNAFHLTGVEREKFITEFIDNMLNQVAKNIPDCMQIIEKGE